MIGQVITNFHKHPKRLFLIDGIGAIFSAFLLGIVLVKLEGVFGIPVSVLYILATLPIFFAIYDFYSYQKEHHQFSSLLKGIATMNLLYCLLSIGFAFYHHQIITFWGWAYLISEISIVMVLAILELKVAKGLITNAI